MPLYEYVCPKCNKKVEKLVFGKEVDELPLCEKCKKPMKRILSTFGFDIHGFSEKNGYSKESTG